MVTSQEKQLLETNWTTYEVENYYIHRWQTNASTLRLFDWEIYKKNYEKSRPSQQNYIIKMMTGWLPVYHHLNKMENTTRKCSLCNNSETIAHLFQCQHREKWRQQFLTQLNTQLLTLHTSTPFVQQLQQHLSQIFTNHHDFEHFKHFTIFAGFLPIDWKHQAISSTPTQTNTSQKQQKWALQFSAWITARGHELWCYRNNQLYDKDGSQSHMDRVLNNKIHQLYELKHAVGYHDQDMFSQPIEERLSLSEKQKMRWIEQTTKTMKVSMADYEHKQTTGQRDIRQFFSAKTTNQNI